MRIALKFLLGKEVHEDTRTVSVHTYLNDTSANSLTIGSFLYAGILINSDSVYSLPVSSLVKVETINYVLVKNGNKLMPVEVTLGKSFK